VIGRDYLTIEILMLRSKRKPRLEAFCLARTFFLRAPASTSLWAERIVYPQAAVGPLRADTFVIDLSIGNLSREETVGVRLRL